MTRDDPERAEQPDPVGHAGQAAHAGPELTPGQEAQPSIRPRGRRVRTVGVAGSDPSPQNEPPRFAEDDNDDRLAADKPPHWG